MNLDFLERTEALLGEEKLNKLINSKIAIFGVGGVGGSCVEVLIRSGVSTIMVVDFDTVDITNLNRQVITNIHNVGNFKVDVIKERILSINPEANVIAKNEKVTEENIEDFNLSEFDYVIDAIDDVKGKVAIIKYCKDNNINIISAMGAGKRKDPLKLKVSDINKTQGCPLARKMRKKLKDEGIKKLKVVYSDEKPIDTNKNVIPSIAFLPSISGMIIGSEVINDITEK